MAIEVGRYVVSRPPESKEELAKIAARFPKCDYKDYGEGKGAMLVVHIRGLADMDDFQALLTDNGIADWIKTVSLEYSDKELEAFCLFVLRPQSGKGLGGISHGTEYDLSQGCPKCGSGSAQISPLRIPSADVIKSKPIQITYAGELLALQELYDELTTAGIPIDELKPVDAPGGLRPLAGVYHVAPSTELPRLLPSTQGVITQSSCSVCARDGHFLEGRRAYIPHLPSTVLATEFDFAKTWELFGLSRIRDRFRDSCFARPEIVVSQRVRTHIGKVAKKSVIFIPVHLD